MTISLPTAMLAKIEHARQMEDRTRSEFVRQAIRVYLAHADSDRRTDGSGEVANGRGREPALEDDGFCEDGKLDSAAGKSK